MKKSYIGILLMIIGAAIIISALSMRYEANKEQKNMIQEFKESIQKTDEKLGDAENANIKEKKPSDNKLGTIGIIAIPKIDVNVALSEGIDTGILKYAVGHFTGTPMPGEKGNTCIAGHRSYTYNQYFNRLDELGIGDIIIVTTRAGEFKYEVYESKVVEPEEISVLDNTEGAEITLVTCTPIRVATHRLIVKGKLVVK
ncbi:class D sortase [Clostridium sp.]|uniref:class D sortase n=1 Tax=Clostridium sp. TaxID=1506 RepID=UPI001A43EB7A|nr:class D sortase [Clostridium sp.]MBK5240588.1 class D sortase [Clostridium sp.]